jgi:serpin B
MISMQLPGQCRQGAGEARPDGKSMRLMTTAGIPLAAVVGMVVALQIPPSAAAQSDPRALAQAYNASGSELFRQLAGAPGNIVLSPLSIGTAMAMALSGARGETEHEMASVLKQRLDRPAIEAANGALRSLLHAYDKSAIPPKCPQGMHAVTQASAARCEAALRPDGQCVYPAGREGNLCVAAGNFPPSARLLTANALMLPGRDDLVAPEYTALLKDKYGAEIFHDVGLDDVNGWVKRKTEGKIERILDKLDPLTAAVILNAVYFKAKWAAPFYKSATLDEAFDLSRQRKISVPTMRRSGSYALVTRPLYRALRLPYEVGELSMIIVLPNETEGLDVIARGFEAGQWGELASALRAPEAVKATDLTLPRFKVQFDVNLASAFSAEGMSRAFDPKRADFSGMTGRPAVQGSFAIGSIVHRAVIDVIEDGTEAAAATAISVVAASAQRPVEEKQVFHVDHPFWFAIMDDASGAVLFQGRIVDPR